MSLSDFRLERPIAAHFPSSSISREDALAMAQLAAQLDAQIATDLRNAHERSF